MRPSLLGSIASSGLLALALALAGCAGVVSDFPEGQPQTEDPSNPTPTTPGTTKLPDCQSSDQCTAPYVCNLKVKKCVPPAAAQSGPCNPIEGQGCPAGQQCIAGVCVPPPGACQSNDDCPVGFLCQNGTCVPDGQGGAACTGNGSCGSNQICIDGICKPRETCAIPHAPDRLGGTWLLDSQLHVRDGLHGFTKGLLGLAGTLQNIVDGKFSISGVPSFLTDIIGSFLGSVIKQYVPPWGTSVISLLADINAVIDDTRVVSLEQITALGNDMYSGTSTWKLVELEYKGVKVSTAPDAIPGLGSVTTDPYSAREVCGVFYMDKHKVKNAIGKVFRWAIEAVITGVSCTVGSQPCYQDLPTMFNDLVDCNGLAAAMASCSTCGGQISGLDALVLAACTSQKQSFLSLLIKELENLELQLTYMNLSSKSDVLGGANLVNGRWYGTLGSAYSKGNFEGTFSGAKQ